MGRAGPPRMGNVRPDPESARLHPESTTLCAVPGRVALSLVLLVLGTGLLAAGCGSSDTTASPSGGKPAAEWADGVCSAVDTWKTSVSASVDQVKSGNLTKDALVTAADDAKAATETLVTDLDNLGAPEIEAGQKAKDTVSKLSGELQDEIVSIQDAIDTTSGVSGLVSTVSAITATLATVQTQLSTALSELKSVDAKGELEAAFSQADSCSGLTS